MVGERAAQPPARLAWAVAFHSRLVTRGQRYLVYLPPGYAREAARGRRFPVLYLLHGVPGRFTVFTNVAAVQVDADVLLSRHAMKPMIMVMPAGDQGTLRGDTEWANTGAGRWEDFVLEVVHDVDHRFATIADRRGRAIAGDSEGAYGAVNVALHHLETFSSAQSWGGYFTQTPTGPFAGASSAALRTNSPAAYVPALAPGLFRAKAPRMLQVASRWFSAPPRVRTALRGSGHALSPAALHRIKERRHRRRTSG